MISQMCDCDYAANYRVLPLPLVQVGRAMLCVDSTECTSSVKLSCLQ